MRSNGHIWTSGELEGNHHQRFGVGDVLEFEYDADLGELAWKVSGSRQKTVSAIPGDLGFRFCIGGSDSQTMWTVEASSETVEEDIVAEEEEGQIAVLPPETLESRVGEHGRTLWLREGCTARANDWVEYYGELVSDIGEHADSLYVYTLREESDEGQKRGIYMVGNPSRENNNEKGAQMMNDGGVVLDSATGLFNPLPDEQQRCENNCELNWAVTDPLSGSIRFGTKLEREAALDRYLEDGDHTRIFVGAKVLQATIHGPVQLKSAYGSEYWKCMNKLRQTKCATFSPVA